jgi:guanylate kinase
MNLNTKLFVVAGPSGCGKTTIAHAILKKHPDIIFSVSATTRHRRSTEIDGKDYYFIPVSEFEKKIQRGDLIEWENIYGDYYGSLKSEVDKAYAAGRSILFDVDVKGALSIKNKYGKEAVLIFIKPPSIEKLTERLRNRKTESEESFIRRMERVTMELSRANEFDHIIVNDELEKAINTVDSVIQKRNQELNH